MNIAFIGMAAALGLSAAGSAFGAGFAGMASVGAWKKCYASGKAAPFILRCTADTDNLWIPSYELYQIRSSRWRRRWSGTWRWTLWRTCNRTFRIIPG